MIDAGILASSLVKRQDIAAENTLRIARGGMAGEKNPVSGQAQAEKVAADFEALFISQMLSHMFSDTLGDDFFGSSESADAYRSLMVEQYGKQITAKGGIGIADYVKKELLKLQEVKS